MSKTIPELILDELAERMEDAHSGTGGADASSPWESITVVRRRPGQQESATDGLCHLYAEGPPKPAADSVDQHLWTHWTLDVTVGVFAVRGEDDDDNADTLGLQGISAILRACGPASATFGGQGYAQLCDDHDVQDTAYGESQDGGNFGASVTFRFRFQTRANDLAIHNYPSS